MMERPRQHPLARLREAREARAWSLNDLEERSGISRSLIYAYERGLHAPRPETVARLSTALGVRIDFFSRRAPAPEPAPIFMRHFKSKTSVKHITAVNRQMPWVRDFVATLDRHVVLPAVNLPNFRPPSDPREITDEQIEQAATALRRHWGLGDGAIRDLIRLAENNGCIVVPEIVACEAIDAFSQWTRDGRPFIIANSPTIKGVRWRIDVAHEIGHLVLHQRVDRRFVEANPKTHAEIERQAFRFAGAFLMPEAAFRRSVPHVTLDTLLLAKPQWFVSVAAQLHRASDLRMVDSASAQRLWKNRNRRGWREREPLDDQIPVDQPRVLATALNALRDYAPDSLDALSQEVGLDFADIARYCGLPENALSDHPHVFTPIREKGDMRVVR
jgi:Zn-dependent peptidase ImmA (M78 family)/transcriptional regulator with XRE-family HTH domain